MLVPIDRVHGLRAGHTGESSGRRTAVAAWMMRPSVLEREILPSPVDALAVVVVLLLHLRFQA